MVGIDYSTQAIIGNRTSPLTSDSQVRLMDEGFTLESFDSIYHRWKELQRNSPASSIFSSPEWSRVWWQHFASGARLWLGAVRHQGRTAGIAPLLVRDDTAYFIGSSDVCDYLDFIIEPGSEETFFRWLLKSLISENIRRLDLAPLRPDSTVIASLKNLAPGSGWHIECSAEDVTVELDLPATWEEYLQILTGKQRHELKRKMRRLDEEGSLNYRSSTEANKQDVDVFLKLFRDSRQDKAAFLTPQIESFFRAVAATMAVQGHLRLNFLELNGAPVAATMCFDYKDTVYLYNSGYDPSYGWLSVGFISKALCIKESIQRGKKRFDFLKGGEAYKYHLGGRELPLYRCRLEHAG